MTQKTPSGNLQQGSSLRPVRLQTGAISQRQIPQIPETPREGMSFGNFSMPMQETLIQRQPFQQNNIEVQSTSPQAMLPNKDFSAISTLKHSMMPMSATPALPAPTVPPVQQSDLERDVRVYSDSAKTRAFAPQPQHNTSGRIEYPPLQRQVSQPLPPQQQHSMDRRVEYAPAQQVNQPVMPQQQLNTNVQGSFAPTQQQRFNEPAPQSSRRDPRWSYALAACVGLIALPLPYVVHILIDSALPMQDGVLVFWLFALILGLLLMQTALQFFTRAITSALQRTQTNADNATLYERVLRSPRAVRMNTQFLLDHLNALTTVQESLIQTGGSFPTAGSMAFILGIALFLVDWRLASATVLVALLYLYIGSLVSRRYRSASQQVAESYSRVNDTLSQGIASIRTRNTLPFLEHTVQTTLKEAAQQSYQRAFIGSSTRMIFAVMQSLSGIILSGLGGYLFLSHAITAGQFAAFALLLLILSVPLATLTTLMQQQQLVAVAKESVTEIL